MTLLELKMRAQSELATQARLAHLHHSTLTLVAHFLHTRGLHASLAALSREAAVSLARETAADNVDLARLVGEWSEAEERKYGRKVKLTRKLAPGEAAERGSGGGGGGDELVKERERGKRKARMSYLPPIGGEVGAPSALPAAYRDGAAEGRSGDREAAEEKAQLSRGRRNAMKSAPASSSALTAASPTAAAEKGKKRASAASDTTPLAADFSLAGTTALSTRALNNAPLSVPDSAEDDAAASASAAALPAMPRPIRTPPVFDGAYAEYASVIQRDILVQSPGTLFADVVGLHSAKQLLNEAVLLPLRFPHFFTGLLAPWKGVLLYGPPGTGQRPDCPQPSADKRSMRVLTQCALCRVVVCQARRCWRARWRPSAAQRFSTSARRASRPSTAATARSSCAPCSSSRATTLRPPSSSTRSTR